MAQDNMDIQISVEVPQKRDIVCSSQPHSAYGDLVKRHKTFSAAEDARCTSIHDSWFSSLSRINNKMSGALEGIYEPGVVDPGYPLLNGTITAGLTGINLIYTLLKKKPGICNVLLDARSLCSGIIGRNTNTICEDGINYNLLSRLLPELRLFISPVRGNVLSYTLIPGGKSPLGLRSDYDRHIIIRQANTGYKAVGDNSKTNLSPLSHPRGFSYKALIAPDADAATKVILYVCRGYHATGIIKAFLNSQAVAGSILGEGADESFPKSIFVTDKRIRQLRISLEEGKPILAKAHL
ncbi:hypothetical protein HZ326_6999 [Fusarium oxysporum f. sp. albedinis]|nr:hypothetical protein HZ326_6999 [Fusarium oxysporum f. sp. albedinis]